MVETEETKYGTQFLFPFEFYEEERQERERQLAAKIESYKYLPRFDKPENDNQRLFNLQYEYYNGNKKALDQTFIILNKVAPKLVNKESKKRRLWLSQEMIDELALDSVALFIEQIKKNELVITTSFIAYLRLQVLKSLFKETLNERFEKWCIINHLDFMTMDNMERASYKNRFEIEQKTILMEQGYNEM